MFAAIFYISVLVDLAIEGPFEGEAMEGQLHAQLNWVTRFGARLGCACAVEELPGVLVL